MTRMDSRVGLGSGVELTLDTHVRACFGTLAAPSPQLSLAAPAAHAPAPRWRQVHGTRVVPRDHCTQAGEAPECDGVWTSAAQAWVGVVTADCVPVLLWDSTRVAALHAGWRGVRHGIVSHFAAQWDQGLAGWKAALGPAIGPCCFEVSQELANEFCSAFEGRAGLTRAQIQVRPRYLDLRAVLTSELRACGVALEDIRTSPDCTRCGLTAEGTPRYRSYRREGPNAGTRQLSIIWRQA